MFEILYSDLHGKIGLFHLDREKVITPTLLPVLDPKSNIISATEIKEKFGFNFIITSAYLFTKRYGLPQENHKIHKLLEFSGNIMMDSGAYQILAYGEADIEPVQSLEIQAQLEPDIGVILDVPTPPTDTFQEAKQKVKQTIENIELSLDFIKSNDKIIWTLPIQGGKNIQLIDEYIRTLKEKELLNYFGFQALGSVVPIMNQYDYLTLFSMIKTARQNLPQNVPFHLFGAGHPMIFPFIVALGCDAFDSAAYVLYAKENRYMTPVSTHHVSDLLEFPCSCEVCSKWNPKEILEADDETRVRNIALHNLAVSSSEIKNIRVAIREGRLWELLEQRSKAHPQLFKAFNYFIENTPEEYWEEGTAKSKQSGLKLFDAFSFHRPELTKIRKQIYSNFNQKSDKLTIFVVSGRRNPLEILNLRQNMKEYEKQNSEISDMAFLLPFIGLVPIELSETYPVSQFVSSSVINKELIEKSIKEVSKFLELTQYSKIIVCPVDSENLPEYLISSLRDLLNQIKIKYTFIELKELNT